MKQLILGLLFPVLLATTSFGQNSSVDEIFEKYASKDGFVTVNISGGMLNLFLPPEERIDNKNIGNIKILSVEDESLNAHLNFYDEIIPELRLKDYNELLHVKEKGNQVVILQKKNNKGKQEFLLVSGGDDNVILYIEGNLDFSEANKISGIFDSDLSLMINNN